MVYVHTVVTQLVADSQISWTVFLNVIAFPGINPKTHVS